jgi:hypothetical protein
MALGKMSKAEIKKYRDYEAKLQAAVEELKAFDEPAIFTSSKAFNAFVAKAEKSYAKARASLLEFSAWLSGVAQEQRDAYEEKLGESERWAESDRASQVESWVEALEMAANVEDVPAAIQLFPEDTLWYPGVSEMPKSVWGMGGEPEGGTPTSFPSYVEPSFDHYELTSAIDNIASVPVEDGSAYY